MSIEGLYDQLDGVTTERDDAWSELEELNKQFYDKCEEALTYRGEIHELLKQKSAIAGELAQCKEALDALTDQSREKQGETRSTTPVAHCSFLTLLGGFVAGGVLKN